LTIVIVLITLVFTFLTVEDESLRRRRLNTDFAIKGWSNGQSPDSYGHQSRS
jgi:hypothetical protein